MFKYCKRQSNYNAKFHAAESKASSYRTFKLWKVSVIHAFAFGNTRQIHKELTHMILT
jgi:hypothetical protein